MKDELARRIILDYNADGEFLGAIIRGYDGIEHEAVGNIIAALIEILDSDDEYGNIQFGCLIKDRLQTGLKLLEDK